MAMTTATASLRRADPPLDNIGQMDAILAFDEDGNLVEPGGRR